MKKCFGTIYPDLSRTVFNKKFAGKVFRMRTVSQGMMPQTPHLEVDMAEWEDCRRCEEYHNCFDFSTAKLAMRQAVSRL